MNKQIQTNITDADRLRVLSNLFKKYNLAQDDDNVVVMYFDPEGDTLSPQGFFGVETPDFYITGDSIQEICDRLIKEQNI